MYLEISNPMDYHVALYIRLSKEDENEGPSQSVQNQESLLREFVQQHRLSVFDTYVDDGWSGTSFDRPSFQRMIGDIETKKVNMVITKDLSRLGRDYIMTGHYMERYFPEHRVRYISLLDGIDTGVDSTANDITPFRAIMNDMYAKDISKKIKLQPLVNSWRNSNPMITAFWWDIDRAVKTTITQRIQTEVRGVRFFYKSGMLFIKLPSGRLLSYVKPRIGENQYGGESVTYEGVGSTKKWERIESYGPKFVENIVQAVSRDILCYAMKTLRHCFIVCHVHDELIIECSPDVDLNVICKQMGRSPNWMPDILLRADGYETDWYRKD